MSDLQKNNIFKAEITGFNSAGEGVCRINGRAVFVPRTLPGEQWRVRILKVNRTAVWGRGEELLSPSAHRTQPACPVYNKCGGCSLMHMDYDCELQFKLNRVNEALRRIGGLEIQAEGILGADSLEEYRNKAIFNFAPGPVCGFYRPRSHDVICTPRCRLLPPVFDRAAEALRKWMEATGTEAYDEKKGTGVIRHLFLRTGTSGFIACIVAAKEPASSVAHALRDACPELTGILVCINKTPGNVVLTDSISTLWGTETVEQSLCGANFALSPLTFFQVNTAQAEKLYKLVEEYAEPAGKIVLDLYCGAGTIGLSVARTASKLIGNDIVPSAIENAYSNALKNSFLHSDYYCGDAAAVARKLSASGLKPDVVITDPPRKGMDESVLLSISEMSPERIVYVSCDPGTLARDLKRLETLGYSADKCSAVDMFPRTSHVESVVKLTRAGL